MGVLGTGAKNIMDVNLAAVNGVIINGICGGAMDCSGGGGQCGGSMNCGGGGGRCGGGMSCSGR